MYRQSYDTFDTHLTCVKVCVKAMSIFDLDFDQDQILSKSDFSCREVTGLFFFSSTKETFFPTLFLFLQYVASFKDLLVEAGFPSPLLEIN